VRQVEHPCLGKALAGNIDSDATIDVWSISTKERIIAGETVTPGRPFNHVNDVEK
jgi:hypothetical protein